MKNTYSETCGLVLWVGGVSGEGWLTNQVKAVSETVNTWPVVRFESDSMNTFRNQYQMSESVLISCTENLNTNKSNYKLNGWHFPLNVTIILKYWNLRICVPPTEIRYFSRFLKTFIVIQLLSPLPHVNHLLSPPPVRPILPILQSPHHLFLPLWNLTPLPPPSCHLSTTSTLHW